MYLKTYPECSKKWREGEQKERNGKYVREVKS